MSYLESTTRFTRPAAKIMRSSVGAPFAIVDLGDSAYIGMHTPAEAYALRDAFQEAGDLLAAAGPHQPQAEAGGQ